MTLLLGPNYIVVLTKQYCTELKSTIISWSNGMSPDSYLQLSHALLLVHVCYIALTKAQYGQVLRLPLLRSGQRGSDLLGCTRANGTKIFHNGTEPSFTIKAVATIVRKSVKRRDTQKFMFLFVYLTRMRSRCLALRMVDSVSQRVLMV
jgi:hypothetical protein